MGALKLAKRHIHLELDSAGGCSNCRDRKELVRRLADSITDMAAKAPTRDEHRRLTGIAQRLCGGCKDDRLAANAAFGILPELRANRQHIESLPRLLTGSSAIPSLCHSCRQLDKVGEELGYRMTVLMQRLDTAKATEKPVILDLAVSECMRPFCASSCPSNQSARRGIANVVLDYVAKLRKKPDAAAAPATLTREVIEQTHFLLTDAEQGKQLLADPLYRRVSSEILTMDDSRAALFAERFIERCRRVLRYFDVNVGLPRDSVDETPLETMQRLISIWREKVEHGRIEDIRLLVAWVRAVEILGERNGYAKHEKIRAVEELLAQTPQRKILGSETLLAAAADIVMGLESEERRR